MSVTLAGEDTARWLRSPVSEKTQRLQPMREVLLRPYFGSKRTLKIFRTRIVIGQDRACDVRVDDPFVSPRHAELRLAAGGDGYCVHDLSSRNGVFLNGVRVEAAPLPNQGTLRLGRSTFTWGHEDSDAELSYEGLVVADPSMRVVLESLRRAARSSLPVLLLGETGTGKDLLARLLHAWSGNASGPFVPVNGALTGGSLAESELFGHRKGAFTGAETARLGALRSATGGTLFLDEVADVPSCAQVKLLRSLETGEVKALGADRAERAEFRLVTATSRPIEKRVQEGLFRLDLYYRIAGFVVHVPPLRDRPLDIVALARKQARDRGLDLDGEAEGGLLSRRWPGNVRELRSCIERAAVAARAHGSPRILAEHLLSSGGDIVPSVEADPPPSARTLEEIERHFVMASLERNGWSRSAAARELGIARTSLYAKMQRFGIRAPSPKEIRLTAPPGCG